MAKRNSHYFVAKTHIFLYMAENERLRNVISWLNEQGIIDNQEDLASKIDSNRTYISHIIKGRQALTRKFAEKICSLSDKLNINYLFDEQDTAMVLNDSRHRIVHDFVVGQGKELESTKNKLQAIQDSLDGYRLVPVYNFDAVGGMSACNDITDAPAYIEKYVPFAGAHLEDICVHVTGNSMIPTYSPGTLLLIRKVEGWREYFGYGHTFVLFLNDGRRILKEVRKFAENSKDFVLCVSHNKEYEPEELPKAMIVSVYKVIMALTNDGF